jgi:large subunit ribosomal protein L15
MPLSIHTIKPAKGAAKKRKRIGRGNASGKGTYAGKGLKGQKSRSGVSNLKRLGMKQVLLRTPKKRGFNSSKPKNQIINLSDLNGYYKEGETVSPKTLFKNGLVDNMKINIKILGKGKLAVKNLKFKDVLMSEAVKKQIDLK